MNRAKGVVDVQCVFHGDVIPDGFEEKSEFSAQMPYSIHIKRFEVEDVVPMHYAETIELLFCENLSGEVAINAGHYELGGRQLFVIPPYTVHSTRAEPCSGVMLVIKISIPEIERYFNAEEYLNVCGCTVETLAPCCKAVDEAGLLLRYLIERDGSLRDCLLLLFDLFRLISADGGAALHDGAHTKTSTEWMKKLLVWTNRNCTRAVTLEQAAAAVGYSKYYLCSRFKAMTGITYYEYLTSVRMSRACLLLQKGEQVQEAAIAVGFADVSHFIQMFKRAYGVTPYRYAERYKERI